ncbi:hypothetical protein [Parasphingopyxis marina]|uniref:Uncharacterized protein n=1 Tax=Parasphingopyxis marina TaxID=2761622 RepID=A0A842HTV3_9SPHN|nr:hypothetical protein [Parasphingopyxis marina]MBC2776365.1 hypothetical protein [Parasphingopyxis marina]
MFDEIRAIYRELGDITTQLDAAANSDSEEKARHLVGLRRRYAEQSAKVATMVEEQVCAPLTGKPEAQDVLRKYRELTNEARSAIAYHQASWPASMLGTKPDEYREASNKLTALHSAHRQWVVGTFLADAERLIG